MSCPFKQFRDIFGKPGTGVHSYRILDTAVVDYVMTLAGAVLLTKVTKIPLVLTTILLLVLGIVFHVLFGVNTNSVKFLGLSC